MLNDDLKKFFLEAFEYKSDFQQFHLVVDEKAYRKLKKDFLSHIAEQEAKIDTAIPPPDQKSESRNSYFKNKGR